MASLAARRPLLILLEAAITTTAFGLGTVLWWLLAGQDLGDLGSWFSYGLELVAGYGDAMGGEVPPYLLGYLAAGTALLLAVLTVLRARRGLSRVELLGWILVFAVVLGFSVKSGFTRHDGHEFYFFFVALVLFVVAAGLTGSRPRAHRGRRPLPPDGVPRLRRLRSRARPRRLRASVEVALRHDYAAAAAGNLPERHAGGVRHPTRHARGDR